jgi:DNA-binding transcriptional LysR family regulator
LKILIYAACTCLKRWLLRPVFQWRAVSLTYPVRWSAGWPLFLRTTRKVALTAQGQALAAQVAPHLLALREYLGATRSQSGALAGRIAVASSPALGRAALLPVLANFCAQYPAVELDIAFSDSLSDLVDQRLDITLRMGPLPSSSLVARKLGELSVVLVAAPALLALHGVPKSLAALQRLPGVGFRVQNSATRYAWQFSKGAEAVSWTPPAPLFTLTSIEAVADAVRAGLGVAPVPAFLVQDDLASGRLKRLLPSFELPRIPLHLCFLSRELLPQRTRVLIDYLVQHFPVV